MLPFDYIFWLLGFIYLIAWIILNDFTKQVAEKKENNIRMKKLISWNPTFFINNELKY